MKGKLDAIFFTGGQPVGLFTAIPPKASRKIKLFRLPPTVIESFNKAKLPYWSASIPASAYPWSKAPIDTVATPCVLVTSVNTPPEIVDEVVKAIFTKKDALKDKHPKWGQVSLKFAKQLLEVNKLNFHPTAAKFISAAK